MIIDGLLTGHSRFAFTASHWTTLTDKVVQTQVDYEFCRVLTNISNYFPYFSFDTQHRPEEARP